MHINIHAWAIKNSQTAFFFFWVSIRPDARNFKPFSYIKIDSSNDPIELIYSHVSHSFAYISLQYAAANGIM